MIVGIFWTVAVGAISHRELPFRGDTSFGAV